MVNTKNNKMCSLKSINLIHTLTNIYNYIIMIKINNNFELYTINKFLYLLNSNYYLSEARYMREYSFTFINKFNYLYIFFNNLYTLIEFQENYMKKINNIDCRSSLYAIILNKNVLSVKFFNKIIYMRKKIKKLSKFNNNSYKILILNKALRNKIIKNRLVLFNNIVLLINFYISYIIRNINYINLNTYIQDIK